MPVSAVSPRGMEASKKRPYNVATSAGCDAARSTPKRLLISSTCAKQQCCYFEKQLQVVQLLLRWHCHMDQH